MAALNQDRDPQDVKGEQFSGPVKAAVEIFLGATLVRDADGDVEPGRTATGLKAVGVAMEYVDNSGGADGDKDVVYREGVFLRENSSGGDEIDESHVTQDVYVVDDQTVAATDGGGTRSVAGKLVAMIDGKPAVRFGVGV